MVYNNTASETDDPQIARELCQMISDEHNARIRLYEAMRRHGWYNAQLIDQQQLQTTQQQLSQQLQQMTTQTGQTGAFQQPWQGSPTYSSNIQHMGTYQTGNSPYQVGGGSQQQGITQGYGQQPGFQQSEPVMGIQPRGSFMSSPTNQSAGHS